MNDKVKFLPLLILYIIVVLFFASDNLQGDESRYIQFANNLSQGNYSHPDAINLWNGPGYPLTLLPFALFKLPLIAVKLMNCLFLFLAVIYFYQTLRLYMQMKPALYSAYLLGIYWPILRYLSYVLTEVFAVFLVCGFLYHFCNLHKNNSDSRLQLLAASVYLGYLALTKIFFGYVILSGLLLFLVLFIWKKGSGVKKTFLVYSMALIFCLPYLFYTYSLTDKIFYWGDSGGMSLYWMSTPYQDGLGDWYSAKSVAENPELSKNHQKVFDRLAKYPSIQRDAEFKRLAIHNIIHEPGSYLKNWLANVGRLLFGYPYSYTPQKLSTYFTIIPNMFLVVLSVLCVYPSYLGRRLFPCEVWASLLFGLITFGGSSLLSAYSRQFLPVVPIIIIWLAFTLANILKIEMRQ